MGMTLEQVVLDQLAAIDSQSQDMETNAHCLLLRGKYLRMLAVQEDPLYHCALWDRHKKVDNRISPTSYENKVTYLTQYFTESAKVRVLKGMF